MNETTVWAIIITFSFLAAMVTWFIWDCRRSFKPKKKEEKLIRRPSNREVLEVRKTRTDAPVTILEDNPTTLVLLQGYNSSPLPMYTSPSIPDPLPELPEAGPFPALPEFVSESPSSPVESILESPEPSSPAVVLRIAR